MLQREGTDGDQPGCMGSFLSVLRSYEDDEAFVFLSGDPSKRNEMKMLLSDGTFQTSRPREGDGRGRWMRGWRAWRDDAGVGRLDEASSSSTLARSALACVIGH